jgi:hypothetical protein
MVDQPRPNSDGSASPIKDDPDVSLLMYRITIRYDTGDLNAYVYEHFCFSTDIAALEFLKQMSESGTILGAWFYRAEWCILNLNDAQYKKVWSAEE